MSREENLRIDEAQIAKVVLSSRSESYWCIVYLEGCSVISSNGSLSVLCSNNTYLDRFDNPSFFPFCLKKVQFQSDLVMSGRMRDVSEITRFGDVGNMYTFKFGTLCTLGLILLLGSVLPRSAHGAELDFEPIEGWNGHLFSSYIVATATSKPSKDASTDDEMEDESPESAEAEGEGDAEGEGEAELEVLGDPRGLLGVTIEASDDDQPVTVTILCDAIMEPSAITVTLSEKERTYIVNPTIHYKYDELAKRFQTSPVTVTYIVESGDEEVEKSVVLTLRSINDCPFGIVQDGKWSSMRFMFAAYVNEQHPFVDKILREALDTKVVDSFTGFQSKDTTQVYRQAYALWHALSLRDVRYSSITKTAAAEDTIGSQHIRLLDESINSGQANCVDGSTLLASLLRKIGIEPLLVHVPGHCYLAFFLDDEQKELTALETTMIGLEIEGDPIAVQGLENVVGSKFQNQNSWKTFSAAIARGTENFKKFSKELQDPANQDYKLISVADARRAGILPIGFHSNQKLTESRNEKSKDDEK